jgi:hypothetical protein
MFSSTEPEDHGILRRDRDVAAQVVERRRAYIYVVQPQCPSIDVVEALQQLEDRALPAPGPANATVCPVRSRAKVRSAPAAAAATDGRADACEVDAQPARRRERRAAAAR